MATTSSSSISRRNTVTNDVPIPEEFKYCESCKMNIPRSLYGAHLRGNFHKTNTAQEITANMASTSSSSISRRNTLTNDVPIPAEFKYCESCKMNIPRSLHGAHLRSNFHKTNTAREISDGVLLIRKAFNSALSIYRIQKPFQYRNQNCIDYEEFFLWLKNKTLSVIADRLKEDSLLKINFELFCLFMLKKGHRADEDDDSGFDITFDIKSFKSGSYVLVSATSNLEGLYQESRDKIIRKAIEFQESQSGWTLVDVLYLDLFVALHKPLAGSSFLPLPKCVQDTKSIINVKNTDNYCFIWSILSALYPHKHHANHVSKYYKYFNTLDCSDITFPMQVRDISKFEKRNNISINVFGLRCQEAGKEDTTINTTTTPNAGSGKKAGTRGKFQIIGPLHHCTERKTRHVNLLYIEDEDGSKSHYCYIKNLSKLLNGQLNKHEHKVYICDGCLSRFSTSDKLKQHLDLQDCSKHVTDMPELGKNNIIQFVNTHKSVKLEFVIYADFETLLTPFNTVQYNAESKFVMNTAVHFAHSFAYQIKCSYDHTLSNLRIYRGKDCGLTFVKMLIDDVRDIFTKHLLKNEPMTPLTPEEISKIKDTTKCYMCGGNFPSDNTDISLRRCLDHSHASSFFRNVCHSKCNLASRTQQMIPVIIHNLSAYDCHLFVKELALSPLVENIKVIGLTKEKYLAIDVKIMIARDETCASEVKSNKEKKRRQIYYVTIRFLDSYRFMASSLAELVSYLDDDQFTETRRYFNTENEFNLMKRKGIFCYEYVNTFEKLQSTKSLPPREEFYSSLTQETVSEEDYLHAQKVWSTFNCGDLGDYSDLYLKSDVLLLTDVFEAFRTKCLDEFGLDPPNYLTSPGLSWDAMLKHTQIKLELLTEVDMLHFIRKSIRGGISMVSHRHSVANNKYMMMDIAQENSDIMTTNEDEHDHFNFRYNPNEETSFLMYLDSNNLYGLSLSNPLPYGDFRWLNNAEIQNFDVMDVCGRDGETGFIIECDLSYPIELHDKHNDLPMCVENIASPAAKSGNVKKLIPNLFDKERYVIHYKNLHQALKHGLVLKKVHRILSFKQSRWIQPYIELNTIRRQQSKNNFEKNFYKLMNNCIFGKSMEAVEKRREIHLLTRWESNGKRRGASYFISNPRFKNFTIFDENLVGVEMQKERILYDKPVFIGFCVLDIAKYIMYDFHYDFIKEKYGEKAKLLYTDTDSLIYQIFTEDIYGDIKENIEKFDTSNYPENNVYGIPRKNKAVLGLFKDETQGLPMCEFVGLRAKLYDYIYNQDVVVKKAKGVKKCVVKRLKHDDYKKCLFQKKNLLRSQSLFRSIKHVIHTQLVNKLCLSYNDDKRYILDDGVSTLAWGHYKIKKAMNSNSSSSSSSSSSSNGN